MRPILHISVPCLGLLSLVISLPAVAQQTHADFAARIGTESHVGNVTGHAKNAQYDYRRYCVGCHGERGDGMGENFPWIDPKPRDFQLGIFKCRSTPTGTLPTDQDLSDTIARGIDRSNMPSWNTFTSQQKADLVAWVKHFSPRWTSEKPGTPIQIPPEPEVTAERLKNGREIFAKVQCWKCHGVTGEANGPSAATLQDDLGRPIAPFNFTEGSPKCGSSDADLYRIFMTGLDGTPMPSFADNIKPDEAWDLVFYLKSLEPKKSKEREIATKLQLKPVDTTPPGQQ
jgi:cytochrome c oxidase cbb3-type subunit 2